MCVDIHETENGSNDSDKPDSNLLNSIAKTRKLRSIIFVQLNNRNESIKQVINSFYTE